MKKVSFLILISILGFSISSCSYFEAFSEKRKEVENASKPTIKINAQAQGNDKKVEKKDPLAEAVEKVEGIKREEEIVGLLKSTNPEVRVRNSVRGRQDPFSTIAVKPTIEIEPEEEPRNNTPNSNRDRSRSPVGNQRPPNFTTTPTMEDLDPSEVVSPTELAENVLITGLVELGDRIRLIVQAPGEATSRYVDIGQYISNGRVLVKRIESNFPTPKIVLEQDGIEITRTVGQPKLEDMEDRAMLTPPPSNKNSISWLSKESSLELDNSLTK